MSKPMATNGAHSSKSDVTRRLTDRAPEMQAELVCRREECEPKRAPMQTGLDSRAAELRNYHCSYWKRNSEHHLIGSSLTAEIVPMRRA